MLLHSRLNIVISMLTGIYTVFVVHQCQFFEGFVVSDKFQQALSDSASIYQPWRSTQKPATHFPVYVNSVNAGSILPLPSSMVGNSCSLGTWRQSPVTLPKGREWKDIERMSLTLIQLEYCSVMHICVNDISAYLSPSSTKKSMPPPQQALISILCKQPLRASAKILFVWMANKNLIHRLWS